MTKIGLLGEVNKREVDMGSTGYRTMIRLSNQSPENDKIKMNSQKNQNLLQWLRNNKESKKKQAENLFGTTAY